MTINQVQLSNTFNEFRQTVNNISNTVNSFTDSTGITFNTGTATVANTLNLSSLSENGVVLVAANGSMVTDNGFTVNRTTNALNVLGTTSVGNLISSGTGSFTGNLTVNSDRFTVNATSGATSIAGTTTFGTGANNAVYYPANGSLILSSSGNAAGTGRLDSNHVHATWHVGSGGNLESWATSKGDNADTHKIFAVSNTNSATDMMIVNQNAGDSAYAEFIAIHADGNTAQGWASFGVNSPNYAEGAYGITKADDAYILYEAPAGTTESGDLVIGTGGNGTGNKIIFSANGFDDPANNTQMVITPGQNIHIEIDTQSSNTTTGALTVNGGIGLVGNLNIGGNVSITGTITLGGGGNTVSTSSLQVDNPIIFVGANNAADVLDLGIVGEYTASGTKFTGLTRDANDSGKWKLFSGISNEPSNTVNFTGATYDTLYLGAIEAVSTTASSSTTSGALIVGGGAGIAGAVNIGGALNVTGLATFTGGLRAQEIIEDINDVTQSTNSVTLNYNDGTVFYRTSTNFSANFTVAVTNAPTTDGRVFSMTLFQTQGSTGYRPSTLTVNGSSVTIKWVGASAPTPTSTNGAVDVFSFTVIRRSGSFEALATSTLNFS
jgi:hypothetical protein